ncbi:MAG: ABC transporter substrate-binding protein [Armatimonadetes bacterium]|nr:ABC transporter substrate-binding protein [Armatimonadota bacterium]
MFVKKILPIMILILYLAGMLAGCRFETKPAAQTRTIVDQLGRTVEIPARVDRIVVLPMPLPSIIYALDGGGEKVVGMHPTARAAVEKSLLGTLALELKDIPTSFVKQEFTVNLEELLKLQPDVVFQWDHQKEEIEKIEKAGIPVIAIRYGTQEDLEGWLEIIGDVLGKQERAAQIIAYHHRTIEYIKAKTAGISPEKRPRVLYLYNEQLRTAGKGTYNHFWIETTGARNVAESISGWGNANMEQILAWNPEIIYISNFCELQPEDLYGNKLKGQDWSQISAVKNKRVYKIPLAGYRWDPPSVESPLMLKWLAKLHHPDLFVEYSVAKELKDFYASFYGYDLSLEKAFQIVHPVVE